MSAEERSVRDGTHHKETSWMLALLISNTSFCFCFSLFIFSIM